MSLQEKKTRSYDYFYDEKQYTPLKQGIDKQREVYKSAMLNQDYDCAVIALDNIKAEIKHKVISKISVDAYKKLNRILLWYKTLPQKYTQKTPEGYTVVYPPDIETKVQHNLNVAYSLVMDYLSRLSLI
jgi:spermidine/putrescine-binding protein